MIIQFNKKFGLLFAIIYLAGIGSYFLFTQFQSHVTPTNSQSIERSDLRWKKNIQLIPNAIDKITAIRGVTFEWREERQKDFPKGRHIGVIAQEVERVLPELVISDREGYKSVDYPKLSCVLIEAVKTQQASIQYLKKEIAALKARK